MATETHIAGLQVEISGRYLMQRCAWCGAVMCAFDMTMIAMPPPWTKPAMFGVNKLIRFSYVGEVARYGEVALTLTEKMELPEEEQVEKLPADACALHIPFENGR